MLKLILFIVYISLILAVIFVERKRPTEALLWVTVLICLPYVGAILYLIFGSTTAIKLTSAVRNRRLKDRVQVMPEAASCTTGAEHLSLSDQQVIRFNSVYNNSVLTSYDDLKFYTSGLEHYKALFRDIREAKECIYIEFYSIHHDCVGEALVKYLTKKAEEGVKVMVMCDFVASFMTPNTMFKPLREAGGQVIRIKPYLTHYRSHRKIVVIDHRIAYIGGMNIGKQYANMHKKKNPWRDTQVRLTGACCIPLEDYFLTDWICAVKKKQWEQTVDYIGNLKRPSCEDTGRLCQFIIGGVDNDRESVKMCYLSMIRSARERIRIQSPYFIPDSSILDALKTAVASGVQVELMTPAVQSSFFLEPVTRYYTGQLLQYGAKVYHYHGYVHAKTMCIDDELCCVGSVNMDMRSLMVDDEVCGVFYPNAVVHQYNQIYDEDIKDCDPYTLQMFEQRSTMDKFKESIYLPFASLM